MKWDTILAQYPPQTLFANVIKDLTKIKRTISHRDYRAAKGLLKNINHYITVKKELEP